MSSDVKRYEQGRSGMRPDGNGPWVAWDDHAALEAENARLVREAKNDAIAYKAALERQDELRAERDAARAQLAAIQGGMGEVVDCKVVPVDLLERTICRLTHGHEHDKAVRELRAILASHAEGGKV